MVIGGMVLTDVLEEINIKHSQECFILTKELDVFPHGELFF
jgi:hypothetical protein